MIVKLQPTEMYVCGQIATLRVVQNLVKSREPRYGAPESEGSYETHWTGCLGEMAIAKSLGWYWAGSLGNLGAADVGDRIQVRSTFEPTGRLILHPEDADNQPFILVRLHGIPEIEVCGWVMGIDGKSDRFWTDPAGGRPAFFVPAQSLRPMSELKTLADQRIS